MKEQMIKDFVSFLKKNAPVELTVSRIRKDFFNNNNDFATKALRWLKEEGFIYANRSWSSAGKAQKYSDLKTDKDLDTCLASSGLLGKRKKKTVEDSSVKTLTIKYKNYLPVELTFHKEEIKIVNKLKEELGDLISEDLFIDYLVALGFEKEKAWFYFDKISNK